jgi:hypothetical protein
MDEFKIEANVQPHPSDVPASDDDSNLTSISLNEGKCKCKATDIYNQDVTRSRYIGSLEWLSTLFASANMCNALIRGNKLNGYVRQTLVGEQLGLYLYMEKQLTAIHSTSYEKRILLFDATGGLVGIGKKYTKNFGFDLKRILCYYMILKNYDALGMSIGSVCVGELVSSEHDTLSICAFLRHLKGNYEKYFKEKLKFRLVVIDYSWASIHAFVEVFNRQEIIEYAHHIYKLATGGEINENFSYLLSCASHTMKRFSRSIQKLTTTKDTHRFICYLFSLLLNSTSLEMIGEYFQLICIIYLSPTQTKYFLRTKETLAELLESRPDDVKAIKNIVNAYLNFQPATFTNANTPTSDIDEDLIAEKESMPIKKASPFTKYFNDIKLYVDNQIETQKDGSTIVNDFFNPEIINHLLNAYMPYAFIWASFSCVNLSVSRLTNGLIENYNKYRKSGVPKNVLPHRYIESHVDHLSGSVIEYLQHVRCGFVVSDNSKKRKQQEVATEEPLEEDFFEAKEKYNKKLSFSLKKGVSYQNNVNINKVFEGAPKSLISIGKKIKTKYTRRLNKSKRLVKPKVTKKKTIATGKQQTNLSIEHDITIKIPAFENENNNDNGNKQQENIFALAPLQNAVNLYPNTIRINNYLLEQQHIETLKNGGWLNDLTIEAYISCYSQKNICHIIPSCLGSRIIYAGSLPKLVSTNSIF